MKRLALLLACLLALPFAGRAEIVFEDVPLESAADAPRPVRTSRPFPRRTSRPRRRKAGRERLW